MSEPFLWGPQARPGDYDFSDGQTTRMNPLVWRRMYLSLEMFAADAPDRVTLERIGPRTVIHVPSRFRSDLDPGDYPYPFWHSKTKWDSYQFSVETLFVVEGERLVGAMRSAVQDKSRLDVTRSFDGDWNLGPDEEREHRPVVLFSRLFSPENPRVDDLDRAFRAFEAESRPYRCAGCHRPDNRAGQGQLEMFCYPNQSLASRHVIVRALEDRRMPPPAEDGSDPLDETSRARLIQAARRFERTADEALAAERRQGFAVPSK
jgi:hypothetical protein